MLAEDGPLRSEQLDSELSLAIARSTRLATRLPSAEVLERHHADTGDALSSQIQGLESGWNGGSPLPELRKLLSVTDGGGGSLLGSPSANRAASSAMASSLAVPARKSSGI